MEQLSKPLAPADEEGEVLHSNRETEENVCNDPCGEQHREPCQAGRNKNGKKGKTENSQNLRSLTSSERSSIQAPKELAPTHGRLGLFTQIRDKTEAGVAGSNKIKD